MERNGHGPADATSISVYHEQVSHPNGHSKKGRPLQELWLAVGEKHQASPRDVLQLKRAGIEDPDIMATLLDRQHTINQQTDTSQLTWFSTSTLIAAYQRAGNSLEIFDQALNHTIKQPGIFSSHHQFCDTFFAQIDCATEEA